MRRLPMSSTHGCTICRENVSWVFYLFFYNLINWQLELIFVFLHTIILILMASKRLDNFPLHPSCVATLPSNTLATKQNVDAWVAQKR